MNSSAPNASNELTASETQCVLTAGSRTSRRRRILLRIIAIVIGLMVALTICETGLRFYVAFRGWTANCYAGSLQLHVPHSVNGYQLAAGHSFRSGVYTISTNGLGLRDREFPVEKPPGEVRIAVLGGSSVFGYLVSDNQDACSILEDQFRQSGQSVEVINAGVPGYNLLQTMVRYRELIAKLQPDIVVLYLGWNDLPYILDDNPLPEEYQYGACFPGWQRVMSYSTLYGFIFHRLLSQEPKFRPPSTVGSVPTPAGAEMFRANLDRLLQLISESRAVTVICSQATLAHPDANAGDDEAMFGPEDAGRLVPLGQWLQNTLENFSRENELHFIDVYHQIEPVPQLLGDVIHLTVAGENELGQILHLELKPMVQSKP